MFNGVRNNNSRQNIEKKIQICQIHREEQQEDKQSSQQRQAEAIKYTGGIIRDKGSTTKYKEEKTNQNRK